MGARTARHIVGAGIGVAASPAVTFLFLDGTRGAAFRSLVMLSNHLPGGMPQYGGIRLGSAWLATVELLAAGVLAGVLAGARRISPVAPLVAGLQFLAFDIYADSSVSAMSAILRHVPASLVTIQDAIYSDVFVLLGGALAVSALAPWRWRTSQPTSPWANWHAAGVIAGMAAVPVLWFVLQLSESAARGGGSLGIITFADEFLVFMVVGALFIGVLAAARWVSPVAAVIAGVPLLAVGLFTLLAPNLAQNVIDHLVYGQYWQPATESLAASGWLVLFGGMVLAAGAMSGRWRWEPRTVPVGPTPPAGPALEQAPDRELAP
jgi:hypothetical protein